MFPRDSGSWPDVPAVFSLLAEDPLVLGEHCQRFVALAVMGKANFMMDPFENWPLFLFPKHKRLFLFVLFCFCSPSSPHWEMAHWVAQCLKEDSRKDFINWKGLGNALHCRYSLLKKACVYLCLCKLHGRTPIGAWMLICNLTSARKKKKTLLV